MSLFGHSNELLSRRREMHLPHRVTKTENYLTMRLLLLFTCVLPYLLSATDNRGEEPFQYEMKAQELFFPYFYRYQGFTFWSCLHI